MQTCGLSTEEAFIVASRRIGTDNKLEKEFGKVNGGAVWVDRILWMLIGIQLWGLVSCASNFITRTGLAFGWKSPQPGPLRNFSLSDVVLPVAIYVFVGVATLAAGLTLSWWLISRKGQQLGRWFGLSLNRRLTFFAACVGLSLVSLVTYALSYSSDLIVAKSLGLEAFAAGSIYFGYAHLIVLPIQTVTMMVATLVLVRRRVHTSGA